MKKLKRAAALMLALALIICLAPSVLADDESTAATSVNIGSQTYSEYPFLTTVRSYGYSAGGAVVNSYLVNNGDGTLTRVEYYNGSIIVEDYTTDFVLLSQNYIDAELDLFGGFYSGASYNFFVFGQNNTAQSDSTEVIRVVRYTKDWTRVDSVGLYGANTTKPFNGGSLRMTESGGYLYIRTSHEMYTTSDGNNHQANLTFEVRESDMTITDYNYGITNSTTGYVSHSFNQFIMVDDSGNLIALDHGDASPRSMVLTKYNAKAGSSTFGGSSLNNCTTVNVLSLYGEEGDNYTGANIGGLEYSDSSYLVAGSSTTQDEASYSDPTRNVFVTVTSRSNFSSGGTQIKWITDYSYGDYSHISTPQLVKISSNRFLLMWTIDLTGLNYVFLDGSGNMTSEIYTTNSGLSDCQPIVVDGTVMWYCSGQYTYYGDVIASAPILRKIDGSGTFSYCKVSAPDAATGFGDVKTSDYFYEPVVWAVDEGITTGTTATTFSPNATCTRGQIITFIWRAEGSPSPAGTGRFSDVETGMYYASAAQWAGEHDIDFSHGTFNPDAPCTRAMVVEYLYRLADSPEISATTAFSDVSASDSCAEAVAWAVANGITNGTSDSTFSPDETCSRAQIVTFLYRYANLET
ncbi:MAG: S-layer homology domain-containing protein [Oscillospiraceae bacterium]|nr:S-layer homology domain-containing protein [Oscillospiraceae bacterium]